MVNFRYTADFPLMPTSMRSEKQIHPNLCSYEDKRTYKLKNGLLKLVESLERKRASGDWTDHLMVKESYTAYGYN